MGIGDVVGYIQYSVNVMCPWCEGLLDLNQAPYDEGDEWRDLGQAIFGSDKVPAKWLGINIEYRCNHCKKYFNLSRVDC